jgi:hypothetical protein
MNRPKNAIYRKTLTVAGEGLIFVTARDHVSKLLVLRI